MNKNKSKYIDLGLPSGTLWSIGNESGLYTHGEATKLFKNLPSVKQAEELRSLGKWKWNPFLRRYAVKGPNGKKIFFKAAGLEENSKKERKGYSGRYWLNEGGKDVSTCLIFDMEANFRTPAIIAVRRNGIKFSVKQISK